jgi:hypothetical protein
MSQLFFKRNFFMTINPGTKTYKLFSALSNGERVSASQAAKRFGIKNISAEVSRIRHSGFAVYANTRMAGNGVQVTEYRIGTPSRKLVAAGYRAMALGLV